MVYVLGMAALLLRYLYAYGRLRLALHRGIPADGKRQAQLAAVAERYHLRTCVAVEVPGLTSAFVCGVLHPVLALPAGQEVDDKVLLHELLHLASHDSAWGMVICLFRCLHWCNPLIWYCADQAGNDLEARCDQRVLERIEGEERRDYGRILLCMASQTYACAPGTSSMANGGKNIRRRIEAIARFKKYPAGMTLVSVCVLVLLLAGVTTGTRAESIYAGNGILPQQWEDALSMASARAVWCKYTGWGDGYLCQGGADSERCLPRYVCAGGRAGRLIGGNRKEPGPPAAVGRGNLYQAVLVSKSASGILYVESPAGWERLSGNAGCGVELSSGRTGTVP